MEHLVVALAVQVDRALESRSFGRSGQAQDGVDVVGFFSSQRPTVYQAKKYERFTATDLRRAVTAYADGERPFDAHRLVVVTTADVRDTKVDLELTRLREQHHDLVVDLWGRQQLSDMLFGLPDLVRRFFGEDTMRVFCRPLPDGERTADLGDSGQEQALEQYLAHLGSYLRAGLHGLVGLALEDPDGAGVLSTELAAWLQPGRHVQVVGGSGTGKSHTLAHTALGLAQAGSVPILMRAGVYEGRVEDSLDESVAPFASQSADCLVQAARLKGLPVVLLLDAINECPRRLQDRLMLQLGSWCRRVEATLVSTGHDFVNVPAVIGGARLRVADPTLQQRVALLRCYGVDPQQEEVVEEECQAFATAFELSMAAQLARRLPTGAGRAALLDAYLSEQLQEASQPTAL
ncbi:ATP-binding protein [Streptomyces cyaneofuscatus]|uniref:ATP-binding protein n=1 Tax=Streptomyces cyaneofuscatus TaxID=66883 RepID=UPI0033A39B29